MAIALLGVPPRICLSLGLGFCFGSNTSFVKAFPFKVLPMPHASCFVKMEPNHPFKLCIGLGFASLSTVLHVQVHGGFELLALVQLLLVQGLEDVLLG